MASQLGQNGPSRPTRQRRTRDGWTIRITPVGVVLLVVVNLAILGGLAYGISRLAEQFTPRQPEAASTTANGLLAEATTAGVPPSDTPTVKPLVTDTALPSKTTTQAAPTASLQPIATLSLDQGLLILSVDEGGNSHLFAYQPEESGAGQPMTLTRLTYGPWDDITPAISPDGQTVAFASNRSGYWDLYLMDLASGGITRLTDTLDYEASPSWSPDKKWLAYEAYLDNNLEIVIQSLETPDDVIRLTNSPAGDFSPAWSPQGRQIAFVSNQSGEDEIWLAELDNGEEQRFVNISQDPASKDTHPTWAPDGNTIAWVGEQDGMRNVYVQEISSEDEANTDFSTAQRKMLGSGDWPVWSADGETILTILEAPNRIYLTAYPVHYPGLSLPAMEMPGGVNGIAWGNSSLAPALQTVYQQAALASPTPLFSPAITSMPAEAGERHQVLPLAGIDAPNAYLHDLVVDSFQALRARIASEAGWDYLASLENAYVPLTSPLDPGMGNDWLYTGRAFATNILPMNAGWMVVVREDFSGDIYWRVYIRALYQDGSAGVPLHDQPWDFDARYGGDTTTYEQGGKQKASIPAGYWIDFTERARAYGWERLPALITWRAYSPAALFNEFTSTGGLNWKSAMLELYPPEALVTPTIVIPPTRTPTATLRWYVSPTPTATATFRPTFTPIPSGPANPAAFPTLTPSTTPPPGG
jgi:TolB protein